MNVRIVKKWLLKEKPSCKKCGAGNEHIKWNNRGTAPATEPEQVLFCGKCKHQLTQKDELEELVTFIEVPEYSFFLRFCHEHFTPCGKCQEKIEKTMSLDTLKNWDVNAKTFDCPVRLDDLFIDGIRLWFKWLGGHHGEVYIPCKKCQKTLKETIQNANEITIGNKDYYPPIEIKRKWVIDDDRMKWMERILVKVKDNGIHLNSFYANLRNKKTTEEVDNYFDHLHKNLPYYPAKD